MRLKRWHRHFNPRSRKGSDLPQKRKRRYIRIFQSTLPRRERRVSWYFSSVSSRFQSTLPRRERPGYLKGLSGIHVNFNPRSREGSDQHGAHSGSSTRDFNPRSREGSDPSPFGSALAFALFQSTLPRRERLLSSWTRLLCFRFQSTLPRRERLRNTSTLTGSTLFQSTLPRRERRVRLLLRSGI